MKTPSLILNKRLLKEMGITLMEFLYLYSIYSNETFELTFNEIDVEELQKKQLLKIETKGEIILRQKSIDLIEFSLYRMDISFLKDKKIIVKSPRALKAEIKGFIDEFRQKWSGKRAGSMGSKQACEKKLLEWMIDNPSIDSKTILAAADLYLKTEGSDIRYLQRADFFVSKFETSRLSAYVEEVQNGTQKDDDWTVKLN